MPDNVIYFYNFFMVFVVFIIKNIKNMEIVVGYVPLLIIQFGNHNV
ncbi:hypothetical protein EV693_106110 [Nicoletella semolina]|uniref:Uncharacterized protein n=1 Tax=Nicoletella semolina TaxID=271160 RepID=A0A4R2N8V7_9PAST|nr:hypothetical protein EV693_106110 [Nicoletella semolina]